MLPGFSLPTFGNIPRQDVNQQQILSTLFNIKEYQNRLQTLLFQQILKVGAFPQTTSDIQGPNHNLRSGAFFVSRNVPQSLNNRDDSTQPSQSEFAFLRGFQPIAIAVKPIIPTMKVEETTENTPKSDSEANSEPVKFNIKQEELDKKSEEQEEISNKCCDIQVIPEKVSSSKKIKKTEKTVNTCGHPERKHYAKGLCNNCYHKFGRIGKPELCGHDVIYAKGLCQKCYLIKYNQQKSQSARRKKRSKNSRKSKKQH